MNLQQTLPSRSSANGFGRRRNDREPGPRMESKLQTGKTNSSRLASVGKEGGCESASNERLVYLTTCLIGHNVDVQVLDGSVFSGIFHATNAEKDFGIILKMARLIKDGSRGHKCNSDAVGRPHSKTLIIPAKELVQVIAKGVPVTRDGLTNELMREKQQELLIDSNISQSRHVEVERELERWVPDNDDPGCADLENIFDGHWNRGWDQFEVNEALFGVKSTFDEELYTTKLEKGPRTRELEKEALRLAREIEGEETSDLHLADERGIQLHEDLDIDEETKFSSVFRKFDDSGYDDSEDIMLDTHNDETFGGVSHSVVGKPITGLSRDDGAQALQISISMDEVPTSLSNTSREMNHYGSADTFGQLSVEHLPINVSDTEDIRFQGNHYAEDDVETQKLPGKDHISKPSKPDDTCSIQRLEKESPEKGVLSADATSYDPSQVSSKFEKTSSDDMQEVAVSSRTQRTTQSSNNSARTSTSAPSASDRGGGPSTSSGPGLSPSSSVGSLSSEKSTLNPHAKEFRLNPNAKSFIPSQSPVRPASPVSDGSFYYPANMAAVPHMHGMPVGIGINPSYSANQPVIFNPQAAQPNQPYLPPNGPQMMFGHPRQFVYMPTYPTEMPYKGREF